MRLSKRIFFTFLFISAVNTVICQNIIWSEDFDSYANGVTVGANNNTANPSADWTSIACTICSTDPDDWWEVRSGVMEARDVNGDVVFLQTESIDISTLTGVGFTIDVTEDGDLEGLYTGTDNCVDGFNEDFADVEYRVDGGAWTLVSNYLGWCGLYASCGTHTLYGDDGASGDCRATDADWVAANIAVSGLSGNTLEIRVSATNFASTEYIRFDNIEVTYVSALPIELTNFTASASENYNVILEWQTASETDNDFFTIERSINGKNWETLEFINGQGNSSIVNDYTIVDHNPFSGTSYYRLKQTDFDGEFTYSETRSIINRNSPSNVISIYPNPTKDQITIISSKSELLNLQVFDNIGRNVTEKTKVISYQNAKKVLDVSDLNVGVYFVKTSSDCQMLTIK